MSEEKEEVTYYRFLSEVKAFLAKLMSKPIDAKPSKYLIDRGVTKEKLIRDLRNKGVLERHEKILDSTNSDKKKATYTVKYKVRKKNFEDRIHWLYAKYFEKNVNESVFEDEDSMVRTILDDPEFGPIYNERGGLPKQLDEEAGAGGAGGAGVSGGDGGVFGGDIVGATTEDGSNGQFTAVAFPMMRRQLGTRRKKKQENESVVKRNLIVTEEQFRRIIEATATSPAVGGPDGEGDYTYPVPFSGVDKDDPTVSPEGRKGGFSMQRIPNTDPKVNEGRLRKNDEGKTVPRKCDKCGGDVVCQIHGEPVFVCEKCGKYFGTMPCKR